MGTFSVGFGGDFFRLLVTSENSLVGAGGVPQTYWELSIWWDVVLAEAADEAPAREPRPPAGTAAGSPVGATEAAPDRLGPATGPAEGASGTDGPAADAPRGLDLLGGCLGSDFLPCMKTGGGLRGLTGPLPASLAGGDFLQDRLMWPSSPQLKHRTDSVDRKTR